MPRSTNLSVATMGIDIGKNSFHVVGLDQRGAIVVRQRWTRSQIGARLANVPPCLIGMEACVGAHHLSRRRIRLATTHGSCQRSTSNRTAKDRRTISATLKQSPKQSSARP
jgi:hypothetical protein